ncbi:MAG: hypothetical protein AB1758_20980 [Candidatus Eremiobacterota bacterium]
MDAIGELNVRVGLNLWGGSSVAPMMFRRASALPGPEALERVRVAQDNLSKLLFGADLSPEELGFYKARLLRMLEVGDRLEELDERLPAVKEKGGVGPRGSYHVGPMVWTPPPEFQLKPPSDAVKTSPIHQVHTASLVEMHKLCADCGVARGPGGGTCQQCFAVERQTVRRVGILVAAGGELTEAGSDAVEMSYQGLQESLLPRTGQEALVTTRMPPRFPRRFEMLGMAA